MSFLTWSPFFLADIHPILPYQHMHTIVTFLFSSLAAALLCRGGGLGWARVGARHTSLPTRVPPPPMAHHTAVESLPTKRARGDGEHAARAYSTVARQCRRRWQDVDGQLLTGSCHGIHGNSKKTQWRCYNPRYNGCPWKRLILFLPHVEFHYARLVWILCSFPAWIYTCLN